MSTEKKKDTGCTRYAISLLHLHSVFVVGGIIILLRLRIQTLLKHWWTVVSVLAETTWTKQSDLFVSDEWWTFMIPRTLAPFKAARGKKKTEHLLFPLRHCLVSVVLFHENSSWWQPRNFSRYRAMFERLPRVTYLSNVWSVTRQSTLLPGIVSIVNCTPNGDHPFAWSLVTCKSES